MLGKLCVCGHEMKPQGKQTLEMNGSSLGSNLWTDHVEVDMYICALLRASALKSWSRSSVTRRSRSKKRRKGVQSAKNSFRAFSAETRTTASRPKTARRSFDEFIVKVRTLCTLFA